MNTSNIKKYAPKARREFIDAVAKRLNTFGITANKKGELQIAEANLQGSVLQIAGNSFDGKLAEPRKRIVARSQKLGYAQLIEQVAYTWFNRLCAIRYMEIHDYLGHGFRVLSHPDNPKGFEIIDHAQDAADELGLDRARIIELKLAGNKDEELYRELLLGQCHKLHEAMPFLFDALDDETELLLPDNLTRTDSILRGLVDSIPEEDWQQVEVIGWLYQFYVSEKKDQVMGKVVKSEDIPAATQLFTPNWIVKYLVQNSVGRQWLQTYPDSAIKSQMEYYIEPAEQSDEVNQQLKAITPESIEPETIKVLDPACGSGHILIEAYNVLKAIYEERGFRSRDIPKMILENNLFGLDIDDRAAQLSGFALMMMARDDDKRIFTRNVRLNVLSLQESNHIDLTTLWKALNLSGSWQSDTSQDLFADEEQDLSSFNADNRYQLLKRTLARFTQAKTFGSLINVPSDEHEELKALLNTLIELQESGDAMQKPAAKQLTQFVRQGALLSIRYNVVLANPPWMGYRGINKQLKPLLDSSCPNGKKDLQTAFLEAYLQRTTKSGCVGFVMRNNWSYLTSFDSMREFLYQEKGIECYLDIEKGGWSSYGTCAFISSVPVKEYKSTFHYEPIGGFYSDRKPSDWIKYVKGISDFSNIPSKPVAYFATEREVDSFSKNKLLLKYAKPRQGMATTANDLFVRYWYEVSQDKVDRSCESIEELKLSNKKWFPYNKGGGNKKWYGNNLFVVNYENDGFAIKDRVVNHYGDSISRRITNTDYFCRPSITWSDIGSEKLGVRFNPPGSLFDVTGMSIFPTEEEMMPILGFLGSSVMQKYMAILNPSLHFQVGDMERVPVEENIFSSPEMISNVINLVELSKREWNFSELSPDFKSIPLSFGDGLTLNLSVLNLVHKKREIKQKTEQNELINDRYIEHIYGLERLEEKPDEYLPSEQDFDSNEDVSSINVELLSYSIGCMLGRYSLDRDGLVYAHSANEGFIDLVAEGAYKTFPADEDGIIPLTDQEWFKDDATNRFREFVQVVWGEEHLQENLDFVAESLCLNAIKPKKSELALETIRRYLSTQFYKDHLKTYKKRPIYWLFSSGKQKAFECLVYLHRYNEGTLSRMRTEYVTPLLGKYDAYAEQLEKQIETADSTSEANRFKKELDALIKKQVELREFDDKLKHYADIRISLDLDDGVKVNYGKFGDLLADVKGVTGSAPEVK